MICDSIDGSWVRILSFQTFLFIACFEDRKTKKSTCVIRFAYVNFKQYTKQIFWYLLFVIL
jgi:hypothetical protein